VVTVSRPCVVKSCPSPDWTVSDLRPLLQHPGRKTVYSNLFALSRRLIGSVVMVDRYVQGVRTGDWNGVQNKIEENRETAIVYDAADQRWEAWVMGKSYGPCDSEREAEILILRQLERELRKARKR
jgi:hypothetical protein